MLQRGTMEKSRFDYFARHATLRQLTVFEAIARLGSYTRAAEELYLTQPTVSMQLKKLSDTIGLPLLEQVGRKVYPTEAGKELYDACHEILETLARLEMKIDDLKGLKRGRLRVAVITTAKYFAPHVLGQFGRSYPGVELALKVTNRERVLQRLADNVDDLYMLGPVDAEALDVEAIQVAPNPLVVMASRDHPLSGRTRIPIARLRDEPFILREPGSGIREASLSRLSEHGIDPVVRMELGSNEAVKQAVISGLGISIMSLHIIAHDGQDVPISILDVQGFPIQREWYVVYPRGKQQSVVANAFLKMLLAEGAHVKDLLEKVNAWHSPNGCRGRKKAISKSKKSTSGAA